MPPAPTPRPRRRAPGARPRPRVPSTARAARTSRGRRPRAPTSRPIAPAGAARSPQSSSSVASTSTSHSPSSGTARGVSATGAAASPPIPQASSAHGPSVKSSRTRTPPSTGSHVGGAPAAGERLPHLHPARHAGEHDVHRARVIGRIEAVADPLRPRVLDAGIRRDLDHGRAREHGGHEQDPGVAVGPQQRRHRGPHPARYGLQQLAELVRLVHVVGPRGQLGVCGRRADRDQRAARVGEVDQALRRARLEHRAAGQHDRGVRLAADPQLAVAHARRGDAVVVEDVEVARQPVEHAGPGVEPAHAARRCRGTAPPRGGRPRPRPSSRSAARGRRGWIEHPHLTRVVAPRQRRAEPGDGAGERLVVPPVRLAPVRRGRRPFPPARARRVVGRVRVVEVRPRADPGQQPVERLLQRPAPARGVEGLDPHPRTVVVVGDRRVELGVAVVVGARAR